MSKKQAIILTALIVFIVAGTVFGILERTGRVNVGRNNSPQNSPPPPSPPNPAAAYYNSKIPKDAELTKPILEIPVPNATKEKSKVFEMKITKDSYSPNKFTVNLGDNVSIKMTAVDGDYDFSMPWMGLYQFARKSETKTVGFGATSAGVFAFECRDYCPSSKIKGTVIVLP